MSKLLEWAYKEWQVLGPGPSPDQYSTSLHSLLNVHIPLTGRTFPGHLDSENIVPSSWNVNPEPPEGLRHVSPTPLIPAGF